MPATTPGRSTAVRTDRGTAWPADPADPRTVGPTLYNGASGVVLLFRRSPTRLLMQLIMTCAIVDVAMLALTGQSVTV